MDERDEVKVALLDGAYRRLEVGRNTIYNGICCAIMGETDGTNPAQTKAAEQLLWHIQKTLGRYEVYPDWLMREAYFDIKSAEDFKRGRLAWIDAMIAALRAGEPLPEHPSLPSEFVARAADGAIVTRKFSI